SATPLALSLSLCFFLFSLTRPPPTSTLFPYTTLFRSRHPRQHRRARLRDRQRGERDLARPRRAHGPAHPAAAPQRPERHRRGARSEEHTSELQSLTNLVCRLLLEKKNNQPT